jgi:hypothetical protein
VIIVSVAWFAGSKVVKKREEKIFLANEEKNWKKVEKKRREKLKLRGSTAAAGIFAFFVCEIL